MENKSIISILIILTMIIGGSIYIKSNNNETNNKIYTSYDMINKGNLNKNTSLERINVNLSEKLESEAVISI